MVYVAKPFDSALSEVDRARFREELRAADETRRELLARFPRDHWAEMTLEEFALGQEDSEDSFCRWMEFKSQELGSIKGGSARKLIIYKHKDSPGWYFPKMFEEEQTAWQHLRGDFLRAFELAEQGSWSEIDELETLSWGPALKLKTLHLYFPDEIIPVYSTDHLRHYLRVFKRFSVAKSGSPVQLNRSLLEALRERPQVSGWTTKEMSRFLYWWADPREASRVFKIAPGKDARFWEECLAGSYICVGWDQIGDLAEFDSKDAFRKRFGEIFGSEYKQRSSVSKKANELWTLRELEPGDLVVANQGTSKILAVGKVLEAGYQFRPERAEYRHTVAVDWDTSYEKTIPAQTRWGLVTVAKVPDALLETILVRGEGPGKKPKPVPVAPLYLRISNALERKGQLILYGPPGTGKTYTARRFAVWWLLRKADDTEAETVLAESDRLAAAERRLSTAQIRERVWWVVANPKEWSWDQLFKDRRQVDYKYGRLQRNYPLVQRGDTVVGYQSTPDKRIVALAKVAREFQSNEGDQPNIVLEPLAPVASGLTYDELLNDPILSRSEPMRFHNQGTLFSLTAEEADRLFAVLVERNPNLEPVLGAGAAAGEAAVGPLTRVTFHPSYTYEDFIEGFRPADTGHEGLSLSLEDGVFKRVCRAAQAHPDKSYLLLVDEINRGNVAKILGELLTLLERDKRGLTITLPQSKETFAVPPNVYLLGTMNTADRSIKLLDAALRRRFSFIELMPDVELLRGAAIGELALDEFLEGLNRRIAEEEGREKQIGHSYLLDGGQPISDAAEFASRFREEILPLLQEYCYDEYATLAKYIGSALVDAEGQQLDEERLADEEQLIATLASEFGVEEGGEE